MALPPPAAYRLETEEIACGTELASQEAADEIIEVDADAAAGEASDPFDTTPLLPPVDVRPWCDITRRGEELEHRYSGR